MIEIYRFIRRLLITSLDAFLIVVSLVTAMFVRLEFSIPHEEGLMLLKAMPLAVLPKLVALHFAGMNRGAWRHTGTHELYRVALANLAGSICFTLATAWLVGRNFPRSVYLIDLLICFLVTSGTRVSVRLFMERKRKSAPGESLRILIYGAGTAGRTLLKEIRSNPALNYHVAGFLDDDTNKAGVNILGTTVLGRGRDAARIVDRAKRKRMPVHEIVIAMPSASGMEMHNALANCRAAGVPCKTIPGVEELLSNQVLTQQIRNVKVDDLLGRQPIHLDNGPVRASVEGQNVLVSGGGGSIGSELCRQIASFGPGKLVIFEQSEPSLFRIQQELIRKFPRLEIVPAIGDIKDYSVVTKVIRTHAIESIFHAAAYKHVPMMEMHLLEAVKNNVLGTANIARAALHNQVSQFLMISSDKAVNPTNVMGLTKRVAELVVTAMPLPIEGGVTKFCSVRFGNVLGSSGSVVPMFEEQIAAGGPVTVTHPEMRRFFMTVREAVQLVLQASTMGKGSEVFVLDMGEPVKIAELARNMIRLAGREPDVDIEIRFVGIRPGEKLYEEVLVSGENVLPTYHKKIRIFSGARKTATYMENWVSDMEGLVAQEDEDGIIAALSHLVPEYQPSTKWIERIQVASQQVATHHQMRASAANRY